MGNGGTCCWLMPVSSVHPHAYGERIAPRVAVGAGSGSSPRIWGTGGAIPIFCDDERFIPTHMGNGFAMRTAKSCAPVHPHAYGERVPTAMPASTNNGSSPRIWGTGTQQSAQELQKRFIPTHMGNGSSPIFWLALVAVHPHAYGERGGFSNPIKNIGGSSPRIWGTEVIRHWPALERRFIPTHMGNGSVAGWPTTKGAVHPHAYGERGL